jgi:hypothetical protein
MKTVVYYSDANPDTVHARLDEIADRIPCFAKFFRDTRGNHRHLPRGRCCFR